MGVTLNIIEHECSPWGNVNRTAQDNPLFEAVRLFMEGKSLNPQVLYVCQSTAEAACVRESGCHALLVDSTGNCVSDSDACLVVSGGDAPLVVFDALLDVFRRYEDWQHTMDYIGNSGGTLQELLDVSEPFLRNNVVVLDPALKLLAYTRSVACDDPITVELIEHGYHTEENIRKFKLHRRFQPWAESDGFVVNDTRTICKYVTVVKSFKAHSAFSLISVMMCNVVEPDDYLLDLFQMFVDRVEIYARRDYPDGKPSGSAVDTFLKDLISGDIPDKADVVERCHYAGIPSDSRFCLFYMKEGDESVPGLRLVSDVSRIVAPAKTILIDDAVVVLCFNCVGDTCALNCINHTCPLGKRTMSQRLNDMLRRYDLRCGRSSLFTSLSDAPTAYRQAREAYALGCREHHPESAYGSSSAWDRISSFDAVSIDYLVGMLSPDDLDLFELTYANSILQSIKQQDLMAKTNNYEFLRAYLAYERRTSVVAEQLHMHRNNVNYRVSRIEEQFGIDAGNLQLRQELIVAYRIRDAVQP